ncbi:MAG: hypothetical protein ACOYK9_01905 [Chlamydiia bacterium]
MRELINFKKYVDYFHDGDLNDIQIDNQDIRLSIESARLDQDEFETGFNLNEDDRIQGILHLKNISEILVNKKIPEKPLQVISECGDIFDLKLSDNKVTLVVEWTKFRDKTFEKFMVYEISCEEAVFYIDESKQNSSYNPLPSPL